MALTNDVYSGWLNYFRLRMYSEVVSQNVAANTSLIRSRVWVESQNASFTYTSTHNQSINGVAVLDNYVTSRSLGTYSSVLVMDNYLDVAHNTDGTKTVAIGATFQNPVTGLQSISVGFVLDTIPRKSTPTWTGNFTVNAAGNYATVINTNRASSSFTHDITYAFGGASGTIGTGVGDSISWTPPSSLLNQIPNATSGTGTITTVTKSGATTIGTVEKSFTLDAAADILPTISGITWSDTNTTVATNIGAYVQNVSTVKGVITSSGVYGSSITSEITSIAGNFVNENTAVLLPGGGTVTAFGIAYDSRGRTSATYSSNFTALSYTPPTIASCDVVRANSGGTEDPQGGTSLLVKLNASIASLIVSGTQKNIMKIVVSTRATGTTTWVVRNTITKPLGTLSHTLANNFLITTSGGSAVTFPITESFEAKVDIYDKTNDSSPKASDITVISTAVVTLDLNGQNVGIGKYHTQGALDVNGDIYGSNIVAGTSGTPKNITSYGNLTVAGETYLNGTELQGDGKTMLRYNDAWLRVNEDNDFSAGIYCGSGILRTDGNLQVGASGGTFNVSGSGITYGGNPLGIPGSNGLPYRMSAGSTTTSASGQVSVTLPPGGGSRFTVAPIITTQVPGHANVCVGYISSIGTTSFNLGAFTLGGARVAATVHWQAVQMLSGSAAG